MHTADALLTLLCSKDRAVAQQGVEVLRALTAPAALGHLADGCGVLPSGALVAGPRLAAVPERHQEWAVLQVLAKTGGLAEATVIALHSLYCDETFPLLAHAPRLAAVRLHLHVDELPSEEDLALLPATVTAVDARCLQDLTRETLPDLRTRVPDRCTLIIGEELSWDAPDAPLPEGIAVLPYCLPAGWDGSCGREARLSLHLTPADHNPEVDHGTFEWLTDEESNYGSHRERATGTYRYDRTRREMVLTFAQEWRWQRLRCRHRECPAEVNYMSFSQRITCTRSDCGRLPEGWDSPRTIERTEELALAREYEAFELEGDEIFVSSDTDF